MKILLAVDGSTYSDAAVDEVVKRPPASEQWRKSRNRGGPSRHRGYWV